MSNFFKLDLSQPIHQEVKKLLTHVNAKSLIKIGSDLEKIKT